ncbi:inositol monophosphatase family protein [Romeria aff. gracilis LEGE 07310]|uniref:Inositol monophosphatase family protein n=1 Tax=Vasconcelosia minhoensis LEGE 07310 TaxID=915328 RepID=A0A8J7DKH7_9CYAN|nr:inositol monophosphatase family protein [Romeria gracilis]MBE9076446.1 inositol monophosphatase family protein [Romeria aff. gracilis LEGE 07310]
MTDLWATLPDFTQSTTAAVGKQLLSAFGQAQADEKADGSLVTQFDRWADAELCERIATAYPDHGVLSEEQSHIFPEQDWCWVIDPIDGTTNFTRGVPLWGISLGLLYRGTPVFGHVYFPLIRQHFHGFWMGNSGLDGSTGAFLNDQPIQTSAAAPSGNQLFSLCARSTAVLKQPFPCKIRMLGVATYNLLTVAAGVGLGAAEATPKIWDIAAVWVITQAAGATWVSLDRPDIFPLEVGKDYGSLPFPTLVVSQEALVPQFLPLVKPILK